MSTCGGAFLERRGAAAIVFGLFVAGGIVFVFAGTLARATELEQEAARARAEVAALEERLAAGNAEVEFLRSDRFLEQQARVVGYGEQRRAALPPTRRTRRRRSPSCRSAAGASQVRRLGAPGGLAGAALRRLAFRWPVACPVAGGRGCMAGTQVDVEDGQQGRGDRREQDGDSSDDEALGHHAVDARGPGQQVHDDDGQELRDDSRGQGRQQRSQDDDRGDAPACCPR